MAFDQQKLSTGQKAAMKAVQHKSTRQRIIQQLTPPTSHVDELRIMPAYLVNQALLVITANNPEGFVVLADGTRVSADQILREFAVNATSRGCNAIRKQMKEHRIALLDRYTARYGAKKSGSRKADEGSRKSRSANEFGSDDDDVFDMFSSVPYS